MATIRLLRAGAEDARPAPLLADVPPLVEEAREVGQPVTYLDTTDGTPPDPVGRTVYRVVQEGLSNARRHAAGRPVTVEVAGRPGAQLRVQLTNDTAVTDVSGSPGTGLIGLTERVELAGGRFEHEVTGGSFHLRAELPWPA
ncbi:hypothetical protein GCM10009557_34650 [Virgisporangium ochraceum]